MPNKKESRKCEVCGQESKALWMHKKTHNKMGEAVSKNEVPAMQNDVETPLKKIVCRHEEIVHRTDCKQCWDVEKKYCGKKWLRCGVHGEHIETDCQKLCV